MSRDKGARKYMETHPGVTYVEALQIVRAERQAAWAAREATEGDSDAEEQYLMTSSVETARAILDQLHQISEPTVDELQAAVDQVDRDPLGAQALLSGTISADRPDLRRARSEGRYLPLGSDQ
jgi:hypothetical protein